MVKRVVGDVAVRVGGDVGPLGIAMNRGAGHMARFEKRGQLMGARMRAVGRRVGLAMAAMAGVLVLAARRSITALDDIGKTAGKLGITTDALQELRFAAEGAGVAQSALDKAILKFSVNIAEARTGIGEAKDTLKDFGIQLFDANGKARSMDDVLNDVSDTMSRTTSSTDRLLLAYRLFGAKGTAMINFLKQGSAAMNEQRQAAQDMGAVVGGDVVANAEKLQTQMDALTRVLKAQFGEVLVNIGPLLVTFGNTLAIVARGTNTFFKAIKNVISPTSIVKDETNRLVVAMGDEISQSQILERVLNRGISVSQNVASSKLNEASARYKNVQAVVAENRAMVTSSKEFTGLTKRIEETQKVLQGLGQPFRDKPDTGGVKAQEFETEQQRLVFLIKKRQEMLVVNKDLAEQMARSKDNIKQIEAGLKAAQNGIVVIGGGKDKPITPTDPNTGGGGGGSLAPTPADAESLISKFATERETIDAHYADQLEKLDAFRQAGIDIGKSYDEVELEIKRQHDEAIKKVDRKKRDALLGGMQTMFQGLASLMSTNSKKLFKIGKVAAIAEALISGYKAATKAWEYGMTVGGPPVAAAFLAGSLAKTGALISSIKGTSFGGGGGASTAGGGGAGGASAAGGATAAPAAATQQVSVNLQGAEMFGRATVLKLIEAMQDAFADGAEFTVTG